MEFRIYILSFLFMIFSSIAIVGQEIDKYGRNLDELTIEKRGLNRDYYSHLFIGYGFLAGETESDSGKILVPNSSAFQLGYLYKKKVNNWYELGFDIMYHYRAFHIKQDSMKRVPNNQLAKKEKIVFNSIELLPFQRIKLKNKHHSAGIFIDMGVFAAYNYRIKHQREELNNMPNTARTKTVNYGLNYTENFAYGVAARIGFNRFSFYGRYYLSDLFTDKNNLPELSKYEVGLKIGIHQ